MQKTDLLVYIFPSEGQASQALKVLAGMENEKVIKVLESAVITKEESGKSKVKERGDADRKDGALVGGITGAVIGLLGGPIGAIIGAAAGAGIGSFTANTIDLGIPNERLEEIATSLQPGNSAIVAVIEHIWSDRDQADAERFSPQAMRDTVREEIATRLETLEGKQHPTEITNKE